MSKICNHSSVTESTITWPLFSLKHGLASSTLVFFLHTLQVRTLEVSGTDIFYMLDNPSLTLPTLKETQFTDANHKNCSWTYPFINDHWILQRRGLRPLNQFSDDSIWLGLLQHKLQNNSSSSSILGIFSCRVRHQNDFWLQWTLVICLPPVVSSSWNLHQQPHSWLLHKY